MHSRLHGFMAAAATAAAFQFVSTAHALVTSFDDIEFWVGSGSQRAALVFDWNDGKTPTSLAWGYRWETGTPTGWDMLQAIDAADPRLTMVPHPGFDTIFGVFYSVSGTGTLLATGAPGIADVWPNPPLLEDSPGSISNPGDHYQSGWVSAGYWEYYASGGSFSTPPVGDPNTYPGSSVYPGTSGAPDWVSTWSGAGVRELSDGSWDAWNFTPEFASQTIDQPVAAVPEPGSALLVLAGIGWIGTRRRLFAVR